MREDGRARDGLEPLQVARGGAREPVGDAVDGAEEGEHDEEPRVDGADENERADDVGHAVSPLRERHQQLEVHLVRVGVRVRVRVRVRVSRELGLG